MGRCLPSHCKTGGSSLKAEKNCNVYGVSVTVQEQFLYWQQSKSKAKPPHALLCRASMPVSRHRRHSGDWQSLVNFFDTVTARKGLGRLQHGRPKRVRELNPSPHQAAHRPHSPLSSRDRSHNFWLGHENTATAKSPFCFQSIPFTSFDRQPPLYKTTTKPALGNRCPINPNLREHLTLLFPPTPIRASLHQHPSPELPRLGKAPRHQHVALQLPLLRGEISRD